MFALSYADICSGVGGIEAEAVMLGQAISMILPEVVGYKLTGEIGPLATSTDVVLTITKVSTCTSVHTHAGYSTLLFSTSRIFDR